MRLSGKLLLLLPLLLLLLLLLSAIVTVTVTLGISSDEIVTINQDILTILKL